MSSVTRDRSPTLRAQRWLAGLMLAGCCACSAIIDSDKSKLGALPLACEPGTRAACPCRDGTTSTQLCNDLARYDTCSCSGQGGSGAQSGNAVTSGRAGSAGRAGSSAGAAGR